MPDDSQQNRPSAEIIKIMVSLSDRVTYAQLVYIFSDFFGDQTQERNTKECEDRIRVYPSIPLHWDERWREGDAT